EIAQHRLAAECADLFRCRRVAHESEYLVPGGGQMTAQMRPDVTARAKNQNPHVLLHCQAKRTAFNGGENTIAATAATAMRLPGHALLDHYTCAARLVSRPSQPLRCWAFDRSRPSGAPALAGTPCPT